MGGTEMKVTITSCKRSLATLWFVGAGFIFFIVLIQSLLGRFDSQVNQVWGWLLPTMMPTLSLIIGVLVFDAVHGAKDSGKTDRFLCRLTLALSSAYLMAVFLVIALQPFAAVPPLELMNQSSTWLGPFQGLVAAAMGAFFVKTAREDQSEISANKVTAAQLVSPSRAAD
jgi:hypothetical protein